VWSLRLWLLAAAVLAVLAVGTGAVATFATRDVVRHATDELTGRLRPAQTATQQLLTAYVDEESGQRGFVLTGDERFLAPYRTGEVQVRRLEARLAQQLSVDPQAQALLREVVAAGDTWQRNVVEEIGQVKQHGPGAARDVRVQRQEKVIFDRLRARLDALRLEVNRLVDNEVSRLSTAQSQVDTAMVVALGLSISALAGTVALLWLALTRPLRLLLQRLDSVAGGEYDRSIDVAGPEEISRIAEAAETMRVSIVDRSAALAAAQHELGVQNERQRLAADLHDTTIQRIFGLGLKLSAVASQRAELATTLNALIEEADEIIRELRRMIFELESGTDRAPASAAVHDAPAAPAAPHPGPPEQATVEPTPPEPRADRPAPEEEAGEEAGEGAGATPAPGTSVRGPSAPSS
jgi:CHASE3 domain sensor protein